MRGETIKEENVVEMICFGEKEGSLSNSDKHSFKKFTEEVEGKSW